jgi:hypothetical protein
MTDSRRRSVLKNSMIVTIVAALSSSLTLWLVESWIKYVFFIFEILVIVVTLAVIYRIEIIFPPKIEKRKLNLQYTVTALAVAAPSVLILMQAFDTQSELIQTILAFLCSSFIPGYTLLRISHSDQYLSKLEGLVLSCLLSYAYTGLAFLIILPLSANVRLYVLLSSYVVLAIAASLKGSNEVAYQREASFCRRIDILALLLVLGFQAFSIMLLYPGFSLLPGMDISRHYSWSVLLGRTPDISIGSNYLLSHLHESALLSVSQMSLPWAQTLLVTFNFLLPVAFYVAARRFFGETDGRIPALAVLFWTFFTNGLGGFSWVYFANLKLSGTGASQLQLLVDSANKTIWGTQYAFLGLWYVPAFTSLMIFLALLALMLNKSMPKKTYFALFSLLFAGLFLTHIAEASLFALFLSLYFILSRTGLRAEESLASILIGYLIVVLAYLYMSQISVRFVFNSILSLTIFVPLGIASLTLLFIHFRKQMRSKIGKFLFNSSILDRKKRTLGSMTVSTLVYFYILALICSSFFIGSFYTYQVGSVVYIPWIMYPLLLGMDGILALLAFHFVPDKGRQLYGLALSLLIFFFLVGRMLSFVNVSVFAADFPEDRLMWLVKIPLAFLAPFPLIKLNSSKFEGKNAAKTVVIASLIGIVVIFGVSTTFLNVEYWLEIQSTAIPSQPELDAVKTLTTIFDKDPRAWLATFTSDSEAIATLAAPSDVLVVNQVLSSATTPEMLFSLLYRHPAYSHPYIYLAKRDAQLITRDSILDQYLKTLPVVFNNSEVTIYNASKPSFPQASSNTVLVFPHDLTLSSQELLAPYNVLSRCFYNFTVAYDTEQRAVEAPITILGFDPFNGTLVSQDFVSHFDTRLDWDVSKGVWTLGNQSLVGGSAEEGWGYILAPLNPFSVEDFTAAFAVEPLEGDPTTALYACLVYSWIDSLHYRAAEIYFNLDGNVYAYFRVYNGTEGDNESTIPIWPGVNTRIKWNFGDRFAINVTVQGSLNELRINGQKVLDTDITNVRGGVGLAYARFEKVAFDNFTITSKTEWVTRHGADYVDYLNNGGTLVVLNTNGYNFFADRLFNMGNEAISSNLISGAKSNISLPANFMLQSFSAKLNTETVSWYLTPNGRVPYITEENVGNGKLIYVNVYPIVKSKQTPETTSSLCLSLENLFDEIGLHMLDEGAEMASTDYVREIDLDENVSVTTQSILLPTWTNLQVEAISDDQLFEFDHVSDVRIESICLLDLQTASAVIKSGKGLFAAIEVNSTFSILARDRNVTIRVDTGKEESVLLNTSEIRIDPNGVSTEVLVESPEVQTSHAVFHELYSFGDLHSKTGVYGQDLAVSGSVKFSTTISDTYTILKDAAIAGSWRLDPPLVTVNETWSLYAFVLAAVTTPIFLAIVAALSRRCKKIDKGENIE